MNIPAWVVIYLPKKLQEKWVDDKWDKKPNKNILESYVDAKEWIMLSKGKFASETMNKIAKSAEDRLDKYILPQMKKRGLKDDWYK